MDPQQFGPGNSAWRPTAPRSAPQGGLLVDPAERPRAGREVHFLRAESHDRLPHGGQKSPGDGKVARRRPRDARTPLKRALQPSRSGLASGPRITDPPRRFGPRSPLARPDLRATASLQCAVTAERGQPAGRPGVLRRVGGESVGAPPDPS